MSRLILPIVGGLVGLFLGWQGLAGFVAGWFATILFFLCDD